jgi:acyl-CoA thioester hydrolase
VEALAHYRRAGFFDDELTLRTELADLSRASLRFEYEVSRAEEVLATGHTRHACINLATGRPIRVPKELLEVARAGTRYGDPQLR